MCANEIGLPFSHAACDTRLITASSLAYSWSFHYANEIDMPRRCSSVRILFTILGILFVRIPTMSWGCSRDRRGFENRLLRISKDPESWILGVVAAMRLIPIRLNNSMRGSGNWKNLKGIWNMPIMELETVETEIISRISSSQENRAYNLKESCLDRIMKQLNATQNRISKRRTATATGTRHCWRRWRHWNSWVTWHRPPFWWRQRRVAWRRSEAPGPARFCALLPPTQSSWSVSQPFSPTHFQFGAPGEHFVGFGNHIAPCPTQSLSLLWKLKLKAWRWDYPGSISATSFKIQRRFQVVIEFGNHLFFLLILIWFFVCCPFLLALAESCRVFLELILWTALKFSANDKSELGLATPFPSLSVGNATPNQKIGCNFIWVEFHRQTSNLAPLRVWVNAWACWVRQLSTSLTLFVLSRIGGIHWVRQPIVCLLDLSTLGNGRLGLATHGFLLGPNYMRKIFKWGALIYDRSGSATRLPPAWRTELTSTAHDILILWGWIQSNSRAFSG